MSSLPPVSAPETDESHISAVPESPIAIPVDVKWL
jgi:hypothetical protein